MGIRQKRASAGLKLILAASLFATVFLLSINIIIALHEVSTITATPTWIDYNATSVQYTFTLTIGTEEINETNISLLTGCGNISECTNTTDWACDYITNASGWNTGTRFYNTTNGFNGSQPFYLTVERIILGDGVEMNCIWEINTTTNVTGEVISNSTNTSIDGLAPRLTVSSPTFNYNTSGANITLTWDANDSTFNRIVYTYPTTTNTTNYSASGSESIDVSAGENQNITAYAFDNFSHINSTVITFNVDRTAPALVITHPNASTVETDNDVDLNFIVNDIRVDTCWYSIDGGANTTLSDCNNDTIVYDYPGYHTIMLYANDTVGNLAQDSETFYSEFSMDMSAWKTNVRSNNTDLTDVKVFLKNGTDVTDYTSVEVSNVSNITFQTADFDIVMLDINGSKAVWGYPFNITEDDSSVKAAVTAYGSNTTDMIYLKNMPSFLDNSEYTGTVEFLNSNYSDYTEVLYCSPAVVDSGDDCTAISNCSGPFSGTACYNDSATSMTVYVPHFSAIVGGNDDNPPTIDIVNPTTGTQGGYCHIEPEVNVPNDVASCTFFVDGEVGNVDNTIKPMGNTSPTTYKYTTYIEKITLFSDDTHYNITFNCTDTNGGSSIKSQDFEIDDTTIPDLDGNPSESETSTSVTITWVTDEPTKRDDSEIAYMKEEDFDAGDNWADFEDHVTEDSDGFSKTHSIEITGLTEDTTYYYLIRPYDYQDKNPTNGIWKDEGNDEPFYFITDEADSEEEDDDAGEAGTGGGTTTGSNATIKSQLWDFIAAGVEKTMSFNSLSIAMTKIYFKVSIDVTGGEITLTSFGTTNPTGKSVPNNAYQYFKIDSSMSQYLQSATFEFHVPIDWFEDNGYDYTTVTVYRYSGGEWNALTTSFDDDTDDYYIFEAETTSFSSFAISAEAEEVVSPVCGDGTCGSGETCQSCSEDCGVCNVTVTGELCGNGICDNNETCQSCSEDCGTCEGLVSFSGIWEKIKQNYIYVAAGAGIAILAVIVLIIFKIRGGSSGEKSGYIRLPEINLNHIKFHLGKFKPKTKKVLPEEIKQIRFFKLK